MGDAIIAMPLHQIQQNGRMGDASRMGDLAAEWAILRPNGRRWPAEWAIWTAEWAMQMAEWAMLRPNGR